MKRKVENRADYSRLRRKIFWQALGMAAVAFFLIFMFYTLSWRGRGGDMVVDLLQFFFRMDESTALTFYDYIFRNNVVVFWVLAVVLTFFILFYFFLTWFTRYFNEINRGIDALLNEGTREILLPPEMSATEKKLNTVKQTLEKRTLEAQLAEQRKNDLVMYLAHDIRTPLTSVIGYLSLLDEARDMPPEQKAKYVGITLEKACRLEKLINEFFEITRYNLNQITLEKERIDLYYMLVQMIDEFYPILSARGNRAVLNGDENLSVYGDPMKLARVFNNILRNAAAYSYPNTEISITAEEKEKMVVISFRNKGVTIPQEKLSGVFERFHRLDEARTSDTGGAGLGLSIAREIVNLHGGAITAQSADQTVTFVVVLPAAG